MSSSTSSKPSMAQMAYGLLDSAINTIVHEAIVSRHREHKMMLMSLDPTTKLPHCDRCNLPRLLDPPLAPSVRGASSDPPADTNYCEKKPWYRKQGHDIYGNPFPKADLTGRPPTKKEREAAKNSKNDGTPASNDDGTAPPSPTADDGDKKLEKGEKKANKIDEKLRKGEYIPWQTCPNCKRSLLITRFAKHLEQCMGLSGRQASRNAMAKMNGSTPAGSRGGTPVPESRQGGNTGGGDDEEEDDKVKSSGGGVRKKVLKKGLFNSKSKKDNPTSKAGNTTTTNGKPPKRPPMSSGDGSQQSDGVKRDHDQMLLGDDADDDDNVHVKKRQKIHRVDSTASVGSQSTAAAVEMERTESLDGSSFVGEDLSFGDGDD